MIEENDSNFIDSTTSQESTEEKIEEPMFNRTEPLDKIINFSKEVLTAKNIVYQSGNLQQDILRLMELKGNNPHYHFSFSGLRRSLGNIHQQQLTNSLDRLLEDSVLEKNQKGYALSSPNRPSKLESIKEIWDEEWQGVSHQQQPIPVQAVYKQLHGKWFGKTRFLGSGYDKTTNIAVLEWMSIEDANGQIRLELDSQEIFVKFRGLSSFDRDKAMEVFSDTLTGLLPVIFNKANNYINN